MVFRKAAHFTVGPEFRNLCGWRFPLQEQRDRSCETAVFESVVADDKIELARLVEFVGQAVTVTGRKNLNAFVIGKLLAKQVDFVEGVFVGKECHRFALCGQVLAKPDAERSLTCTTGAKASDDDELGIL